VIGYVVLVRDLSAGDGVPTALARLREAERALEDAAGVAHDLNNLVTILLAVRDEDRAVGRSARSGTGDVVARMRILVQTFLAAVKGLRRPHVLVSVNEAVTNALRLVQQVALREQLDVVVRLDPGCRPVLADSLAIEEAILNVVTNACHASSPGAEIFVETKTIRISERLEDRGHRLPPGTYVVVTVRDIGCGMSDRVLSHLFEPFFTTRASSQGTGLGLFGAQRLANDLGGSLLVHSTEGHGTLVEFYLPAAE
jgi:signal transduction histidine kinase